MHEASPPPHFDATVVQRDAQLAAGPEPPLLVPDDPEPPEFESDEHAKNTIASAAYRKAVIEEFSNLYSAAASLPFG